MSVENPPSSREINRQIRSHERKAAYHLLATPILAATTLPGLYLSIAYPVGGDWKSEIAALAWDITWWGVTFTEAFGTIRAGSMVKEYLKERSQLLNLARNLNLQIRGKILQRVN